MKEKILVSSCLLGLNCKYDGGNNASKEVDEFLKQVEFLYSNGVDAILMQDYGMINLVRRIYPNLEIHASTQANNSSIDTIRMFYNLGVKRVVLSRELSKEEIEKIDIPIELEVFIHGALCISYSGNCLMSSMIGSRSGNRGECAGSCRLKYDLLKDGKVISKDKYLLSTKELNTSYNFDKLLNSNIKSFKIEGRMKSPEYVGFITRFYRKLIDGEKINLEEELNKLRTIYNRKFTEGHLFNSKDILNIDTPNHIGLEIGKVINITKSKIKIKLNRELNQFDGIRFLESSKGLIVNYLYDDKNNLISSSNNIAYIDNKIELTTKDRVFKTLDKKLVEDIEKYNLKKIGINIYFKAHINNKIKVILEDNCNKVEVEGNTVQIARNYPIKKEDIEKQLIKLGNTPFICNDIKIDISNNIFIPIKELNELRRQAISFLVEKRKHCNRHLPTSLKLCEKKRYKQEEKVITVFVKTEEQLLASLECNVRRIYTRNKKLYQKYRDLSSLYLETSRTGEKASEKSLVTEIGALSNKNSIGDYTLNICNHETVNVLSDNLKPMTLSIELPLEEIKELMVYYKGSAPVEVFVYGRVRLMLLKYCLLKDYVNKASVCSICSEQNYYLVDRNGKKYPLETDPIRHMTTLMHYKQIDRIDDIKHYITYGITCFRIDFYDESKEEAQKIIRKVQGEL